MRVVDTSAWIEWLMGTRLGQQLSPEIPPRSQLIVPTIVQLELAKWLLRETDQDETDQVMAYTGKCRVVSLDTRIALKAAELHRQHKLATANAVVYATALEQGADLLTCDAHFDGLANVLLFGKTTS